MTPHFTRKIEAVALECEKEKKVHVKIFWEQNEPVCATTARQTLHVTSNGIIRNRCVPSRRKTHKETHLYLNEK